MKLWKGRFSKAATSSADEFNASIEFDQRLYREDITGSIAHARMLGKQGIITPDESLLIVETLQDILKDIEEGKVESARSSTRQGVVTIRSPLTYASISTKKLPPSGPCLQSWKTRWKNWRRNTPIL